MFLTTKIKNSFWKKPANTLCDLMNNNAEFKDCRANWKAVARYRNYMVFDFVTHFFVKTPILPPIFANQPSNHWNFWHFFDQSCLWGHIWQENKTMIVQEWHQQIKNWLKVPWNSNVGLSLHCVLCQSIGLSVGR